MVRGRNRKQVEPEIMVVGAGAAGLAAAGALARAGWRVQLIEARDRIGGRIFSARPAGWPQAVELGAEFIHGGNPEIRATLKRARIKTRPVRSAMWICEQGVLQPMEDYWEMIGRVAGRIPPRDRGWSFHQFLQHQGDRISPHDRAMIEAYVGSFNAAPTSRIGAHALRDHRAGADTEDLKMVGRYDAVVRALRREWPRRRVELRLNTEVTRIVWRAGRVELRTKSALNGRVETLSARAVVVTLPLGVLKARSVKFSPRLPAQEEMIKHLGWGQVARIVVRFRPGFWSAPFLPRGMGARQGRGFGFLNAPGEAVPVWWALAAPSPILTGWAGGPVADKFKRSSPAAILKEALGSLAHVFGTSRRELRHWVADWLMHDWRHDRFALGAYSFPAAGQESAGEQLAQPVAGTLFFAGEALAADYGTVHGAIETGLRAARQVERVLAGRANRPG